ncbi:MAG: hypothetical protein GY679_01960 [Mycoplasma sp.]|nr:hypothetical protein [Mycoplasma sp.]
MKAKHYLLLFMIGGFVLFVAFTVAYLNGKLGADFYRSYVKGVFVMAFVVWGFWGTKDLKPKKVNGLRTKGAVCKYCGGSMKKSNKCKSCGATNN